MHPQNQRSVGYFFWTANYDGSFDSLESYRVSSLYSHSISTYDSRLYIKLLISVTLFNRSNDNFGVVVLSCQCDMKY